MSNHSMFVRLTSRGLFRRTVFAHFHLRMWPTGSFFAYHQGCPLPFQHLRKKTCWRTRESHRGSTGSVFPSTLFDISHPSLLRCRMASRVLLLCMPPKCWRLCLGLGCWWEQTSTHSISQWPEMQRSTRHTVLCHPCRCRPTTCDLNRCCKEPRLK